MKITETTLGPPVIAYLQAADWTVYQEVLRRGSRADLVATKGPLVWVLELKTSLSLALIEQCEAWVGKASYVSAVVPCGCGGSFTDKILRGFGIGLLRVRSDWLPAQVEPCGFVQPRLCRRPGIAGEWAKHLYEEQKTFCEAGSQSGAWSPWKATCHAMHAFVLENQGCTMKQAIEGIRHHYRTQSTAISSMRQWVQAGRVPGLRIEVVGGKHLLFAERGRIACL